MLKMVSCLGVAVGGIGALIYTLENSIKAFELIAHPPNYQWSWNGLINAIDHAR